MSFQQIVECYTDVGIFFSLCSMLVVHWIFETQLFSKIYSKSKYSHISLYIKFSIKIHTILIKAVDYKFIQICKFYKISQFIWWKYIFKIYWRADVIKLFINIIKIFDMDVYSLY